MPSEETILCPLCGKVVPSDVKKCPFCDSSVDRIRLRRQIDKVIERRIMRRIKANAEEEPPASAVPSAPLPDVKVTCPNCSMDLEGHEAKCSRCGIPLLDEEDMLECPECSARFAPGTGKCPKCGVAFVSDDEIPPSLSVEPAPAVKHAPSPPPMPRPPAVQPGHEVAGRGLTNGRGAINGTGLVNGTGMINGTGGARPGPSKRRGIAAARWQFLAVLVALVIIIPTFIYMSYSKDQEGFAVDGRFGDWADSDMYTVDLLTTTPLTVVEDWAVGVEGTSVFMYVKAAGNIMGTSSVESLFLFIDSDDDPGTGYMAGALGADFMIELDGWNSTIQSADVFTYDSSEDRHDWSTWKSIGGVVSSLDGNRLEAMGNLQTAPSADAKFLLASQDQLYRRAVSATVPAQGGVLVVTQRLSDSAPVSGVLPSSATAPILTLEFWCDGASGTVDAVQVEKVGFTSMAGEIDGFSIQVGEVVVKHLAADVSMVSPGQLVSAHVTSGGIQSSFASVVVTGHPARAYVGSAPSAVHIDGAFGDWYGRTVSDTDLIDVANANVDVKEVGVFNTTVQAAFFVNVYGEMLGGSYVPVIKGKPVAGGGGIVVPMRKTAEDITWIFIDSDMSAATGKLMSVDSKVIGADYRLEVRGVQGMVVSSSLHEYTGSSWSLVTAEVVAEVDAHRLEAGVPASAIGGQAALDFIVQTTDWRGVGDYVALDDATMLALTGGLSMSVGTEAWAVDSSASQVATSLSSQRKLFYDGTNFWSIYFDGSDTVSKYSSDGGLTWTDAGQVFETSGVGKASLWYDSSSSKVYVIGDTSSASEFAYVRNGTVTASPASITWGNEVEFDISTTNYPLASKNTYITKDETGSVWVVVTTRIHVSNEQYNLRTASTVSGDDIEGQWADRGNLVSPRMNDPYGSATLLPGKTGSGVAIWAVYGYEGSVRAARHSGSGWSSEMTIYLAGSSTDNTIYAPPSALIDGNGVVHVLYGTGDVAGSNWKPNIHHVYSTSTTTWSTPTSWASDANVVFKYPTISLDSSTGNVYALWISDGASADGVEVRKNVSGSWSSVSLPQTSYVKTHLTSIYSAPAEAYICWQWTQNSTSPFDVVFDKIPEFSDAALPVLLVLTVFIAIYRRRSKDEGKK